MRILIIGAGAVGGYIGSKLIASGCDVSFVARGDRLKTLSDTGLAVRSPLGDMTTPVAVFDRPPPDAEPQLIVLAIKAPALAEAIDGVKTCAGRETRILPVLNGVRHLETLQRAFPRNAILGGIAHGALTLAPDGAIDHLSPFFSLTVGCVSDGPDPIAQTFVERLKAAGVDVRLSSDIHRDLWSKFVFLSTFAGITCLMRANIGTIMASPKGSDLTRRLFSECLEVARREGHLPDADSRSSYMTLLSQSGSGLTSSMLRDVEKGRRTEWDHILGDMLRRATAFGIDAPMLEICASHLACYEAGRIGR